MELPSGVVAQGTEIGVAWPTKNVGAVRGVSFSGRVQSGKAFDLPVGSKRMHGLALW